MKPFQNLIDDYKKSPADFIFIALFALIIFGFATPDAHAPISIGVLGLLIFGIYHLIIHRATDSTVKRNWVILLPALYFFVTVLSGINSENKSHWLDWVRITLPFLCLPIVFYGANPLNKERFEKFLMVFVGIMSISLFFVLFWFLLHFEDISVKLRQGTPIPTPHSHIRYSLLLTFAFYCALWLRTKLKYWWAIAIYLFVGIHILSVRSALLSLYIGILFFAFRAMFNKQKVLGIVIAVNTVILLVVTYTQIPSLQNRLNYMSYDFEQWQQGNIEGNSDGMRLASIQTGWEMWCENFWTGVGIGDIKQQSQEEMRENYPSISDEKNLKMPHNQFLWTACATGVFGLFALLFIFFFPIVYFRHEINWLFIILQLLFGSAFMVEYMLGGQVGATFYVLFQSLFYSFLSNKKNAEISSSL